MKTLLKLSVFASILILIAMGCKKLLSAENILDTNLNKEFTVATVKEWYYEVFIKSAEFASYNQKENGIKMPDWKSGKSFNIENNQIVEFPLLVRKKLIGIPNTESKINAQRIVEASLHKIVFVKNKNKSIAVKVMMYIPEFNYLKNQNYDISNLSIKDYSKSFIGTLRIFDWSGKFENGIIFKNSKKYSLKESIKSNDKTQQTVANRNAADCGGLQEVWFEYICPPEFAGDKFDANYCQIIDILDETYTPYDCGSEEAENMCEMYGICDENPEPIPCDPALISTEEQEFNDYKMIETAPVTMNAPPSDAGQDPISGVITWDVAKAAFGGWKIQANTQYSYYHSKFFNIITNSLESSFDLFVYKTTATYFMGSNSLITSTWTPRTITDQVINNNSTNTQGISHVIGTIRHQLNVTLKLPYCSSPTLDFTDNVNNKMNFSPR